MRIGLSESRAAGKRIDALDVARGVALVAMATYHFSWDLDYFGYLPPGSSTTGVLKLYARSIASSFLFLVGVGLVLAHANGIRWRAFARRWVKIAAAALLISVVTFFATPQSFVFFGILHHIAFASIAGLAFLRLPWWGLLVLAAATFAVTPLLQAPHFATMATYWTGLSSIQPQTNDFVPVLPWFSAVLAGMGIGRLVFIARTPQPVLTPGGWTAKSAVSRLLALFGRWSLTFYLLHQPILFGLVLAYAQVFPAGQDFSSACNRACAPQFGIERCIAYCTCAQAELAAADKLTLLESDPSLAQTDLETSAIIAQCAFEAGINANEPSQ